MREADADRIDIVGLEVRTVIGIFPWERKRRQRVVLDVTLYADTRRSARTDRIEDALDYRAVSHRLRAFVARSRFRLMERLAGEVARVVLDEFRVRKVTVRAGKPGALRGAETVAVTITRRRR